MFKVKNKDTRTTTLQAQQINTCSKSRIEILEKDVKKV